MTPPTLGTLPPELIYRITEVAHDLPKGRLTLKSFALTARVFLEHCQRRLFRSITLAINTDPDQYDSNPEHPPPKLVRICDTFKENPVLRTYVRNLHLLLLDDLKFTEDNGITFTPTPWMVHHGVLIASILDMLDPARIKWVHLMSLTSTLFWCDLHSTLNRSLSRIFASQSAKNIVLRERLLLKEK